MERELAPALGSSTVDDFAHRPAAAELMGTGER
jgi:hypothetical protein